MKTKKFKQITVTGNADQTLIIPVKNIWYISSKEDPADGCIIYFKGEKKNVECKERWSDIQNIFNKFM